MRILAAAVMAMGLLVAPVARAQQPDQSSPKELLDEAGQKLLQALKMLLMAIPQYAAPEINENGDIIIRRIHPDKVPAPSPPPAAAPDADKPLQTNA